MDAAYELPIARRAFFAPRFPASAPKQGDRFARFAELTAFCAAWLNEVGAPCD